MLLLKELVLNRFPLIIVILLILNGCAYRDYTGFYYLGKYSQNFVAKPASQDDNKRIESVIRSIAVDFGFKEDTWIGWGKEKIFFSKNTTIKTKYDNLEGAHSAIGLYLNKGEYPSIGISDNTNVNETEFVKALKKELEKRLESIIDMKGVRFIRQRWNRS